MASNNVTTDWQSVKATAATALLANERKVDNLVDFTLVPLSKAKREAEQQISAAFDAIATAKENKQDPAPYQEALKFAQNKLATVQASLDAGNRQYDQLVAVSDGYQKQIDEANKQIAKQATGTAPGTNNKVAATTTPASSSPGNPNVASKPAPITNKTDGTTVVNTTSQASGSKAAVPSPSTAEAKPNTPANKIVKPATKTITVTRTVTSDGVPEALKNAPVGAQWNRPGSKDGKVKAQNLRKTKDGFVAFASGGAPLKLSPAEAAKFFRDKGLNNANNPAYMPKKTTTQVKEQKVVTDTKGAPKTDNSTPLDPGDGIDYVVKKGDTLSAIAKKYGTTVEALLKANPQIKNANLIKVGEVIRIPGKDDEPDPGFDNSDILLAEDIQTGFDQANFEAFEDWRVRLSLAPGADYLYAGTNPGILQPLIATNGVVFPYTPNIVVAYAANYNPVDLVHSNYKVQQYTNSSVDQVTLTCDFTAQDAYEARYVLAVIHFFRTMTKMFYGQDQYPIRGTPPPLCYLYGLGGYQFSAHPLVINSFNYNLPTDVDYIQTTTPFDFQEGATMSQWADYINNNTPADNETQNRLGDQCSVGAGPPAPKFTNIQKDITTYVPTKLQLTIGCLPIMSRNQVSNYFSLNDYASGYLIKGTSRPGGGMW